jgi:hypothetical protein
LESGDGGLDAGIVKAHAIDESLMLRQTEEPGLRIAGLRARREGAHLDKTKTNRAPGIDTGRGLVHPCGKTEDIGKGEAQNIDRFDIARDLGAEQSEGVRDAHHPGGPLVSALGIETKQE